MPTAEQGASNLDTPLMRQYQAIKDSYPHAVVFFRLGDFYEMFGDDAKLASPILGLVLTGRQGVPMCGVPVHSVSNYISKLLKAGHKVALAEQMEDPSKAKGLVKRQVIRLITPGTVVEEDLLDATATNYLVALEVDTVGWGLACMEISTGEFWATQAFNDAEHRGMLSVIARLDPAEVLVHPAAAEKFHLKSLLNPKTSMTFHANASARQDPSAKNTRAWHREPAWHNRPLAVKAATKVLEYVLETQSHLSETLIPEFREPQDSMQLDESAIRTLELLVSSTGDRQQSLLGVLDHCRTAMGSRKLKQWLLHPILEVPEIERRHHCVEELFEKDEIRRTLFQILNEVSDLERVVSRLNTRSASPRDLAALRDCLVQVPAVQGWIKSARFCSGLSTFGPILEELADPLRETFEFLHRALAEQPPLRLLEGGIIKTGFDAKLDELRSIKNDSQKYLAELEAKERIQTGIGSLKVGFNSVFGYYIEVTRPHLAKVPPRFHRKQTLTNAERFITPELKELESKILGAEDKILRLEAELFESVRIEALKRRDPLTRLASVLAELDVLGSLAEAAHLYDWVKPKVDLSFDFAIEDGRHPVVETVLPAGAFVPNSLVLNGGDPQILILTGPNMGGKSTFLRQNAIMAILAQMGSFVPAKSAVLGIVDKILTRIGAQDALARNESTFMVEMRETSHILRTATPRSLIILDEVGRGTSTFDGISIAWAVLEHLNTAYRSAPISNGSRQQTHSPPAVPATPAPQGPRTLFATHYFELTQLSEIFPGVANANAEAREWTNAQGRTQVVFLHKISPGPADRSFGIHVAQLAGLPASCLQSARKILTDLENKSRASQAASQARARGSAEPPSTPVPQSSETLGADNSSSREPMLPLFQDHPVLEHLRRLDTNELTPIEALNHIAAWKKSL